MPDDNGLLRGESPTRDPESPSRVTGEARRDGAGSESLPEEKGYAPEAYAFLEKAMLFTRVVLAREGHVTGTELLDGFRELALRQFGPMARVVLEHWGVSRTEDVGAMVKKLVEGGTWSRREEDSWEDFRGAYDFQRVFDEEYPWNVRELLNLPSEADGD